RMGNLNIDREAVASITRLKGSGILWNGPFGPSGWVYNSDPKVPLPAEGRRWRTVEGGSIATVGLRQRVTLPWKLDKPVEVAFEIRSSERPEFELRLLSEKFTDAITTWDDEVVLRRGGYFVPLTTLSEDDRSLSLRFFWDPASSRGAVATREGKVLGRWEIVPDGAEVTPGDAIAPKDGIYRFAPSKPNRESGKKNFLPPDGITWINRGKDLVLESLLIRRWDGNLPKEQTVADDESDSRFETTDGTLLHGNLLGLNPSGLSIGEADSPNQTIPLDRLLSAHFPKPSTGDTAKTDSSALLQFGDGSLLNGTVEGLADGRLKIQSPFSPDPIDADAAGLSEIRWNYPPEAIAPLIKFDKIAIGTNTVFHGTWEPSASDRLCWRLIGASQAVPLAENNSTIEITRATPEDRQWPRAATLFYLSDGQIAPGELVAIDEDGKNVTVKSDLIGTDQFHSGTIDAVQFPGPELHGEGFADPGWQYPRGRPKPR
ncbi:MAG: hypothetical protein KDM63_20205, partial [Verrucomicrobiae bacterium]|nr:hypothetical protein [Verrucomicrobiae bacterium]